MLQIMTNLFLGTSILTGQISAISVCLCRWTQYDRLRDGDGRAPGLLGWWPQRACTFVDNHDTGQRPPLHCMISDVQSHTVNVDLDQFDFKLIKNQILFLKVGGKEKKEKKN